MTSLTTSVTERDELHLLGLVQRSQELAVAVAARLIQLSVARQLQLLLFVDRCIRR